VGGIPCPDRHEIVQRRRSLRRAGGLVGRRILEVGCGAGVASVAFANSGAHVTVDVSASALRVTRERAVHFGVANRVATIQSPAELLDFPANSFELFFAKSVVHHLIIDEVMPRMYRFLVPGGRGAIFEPQSNPILDFARAHVPYPGKVGEEHGTDEFFTQQTSDPRNKRDDAGVVAEDSGAAWVAARGDGSDVTANQEGTARITVAGILVPGPCSPADGVAHPTKRTVCAAPSRVAMSFGHLDRRRGIRETTHPSDRVDAAAKGVPPDGRSC
jgi:SAM-dependent methyltransferase